MELVNTGLSYGSGYSRHAAGHGRSAQFRVGGLTWKHLWMCEDREVKGQGGAGLNLPMISYDTLTTFSVSKFRGSLTF